MVVFDINHTNYKLLIKDLASHLGIPYHHNSDHLVITPPAGNGIIRTIRLFDEFHVLLVNAVFNGELVTKRQCSDDHHYILHFDHASITQTIRFEVDDEFLQKTNAQHSVARLTSNIFSNTEIIPPGLHIKSVKILFNEKWLKKYLDLDQHEDVLQKYLLLKTESFDLEQLDDVYLRLLDDLWKVEKEDHLQNTFLQDKVITLIERFFTRIHDKMDIVHRKCNLTGDELSRLLKVEQVITSNLSVIPPTINQCARMASMSTTKLKLSFKKVFGDSIYSYYQKLRMQRAKELILTEKLNVKQAAQAVGYDNTSNFIIAFKKQFNISPGTIVKAA